MRSVSGHLLTTQAEVVVRRRAWRRGKTASVSLESQGQRIAEIESRFVPTELVEKASCRTTTVAFVDGTRWSIVTGAPDEPPEAKKRFGVTHGTRHPVAKRVARVTEERDGRLLAEAVWPDRKLQKQMLAYSMLKHGPNPLERLTGFVARSVPRFEAPQITVAGTTLWFLPVEIPGRFMYGTRLGELLTILSGGRTTKLIPHRQCALRRSEGTFGSRG